MKKIILSAVLAAVLPLCAFATDANQMHYIQLLSAQAPTLVQTDLELLPAVEVSDGSATAFASNDVSTLEGYAIAVSSLGVTAAATTKCEFAYGYTAASCTSVVMVAYTQTTATAVQDSYEFDFDTLQGTNSALYISATISLEDGSETNCGFADIIYSAARSAAQTITGSGTDIAAYKGNATLWIQGGAPVNEATNFSNVITFQHATASTGTFSTVTNLAGAAASFTLTGSSAITTNYPIDLSRLHQYVRVVSVQTNDAASVSATLIAPMKSQ